jgi:ubiquinol-cytochrome c reductase iron-sulfur subunit
MTDTADPGPDATIGERLDATTSEAGETAVERSATAPPARAADGPPDSGIVIPSSTGLEDDDPRREKRAERAVSLLFQLSAVTTIGFLVVYWVGNVHKQTYTPWLGGLIGVSLTLIGAGFILWAKTLFPDEEAVQERHSLYDEREHQVTGEVLMSGLAETQVFKRPLLRRSLLGSVTLLGLPAVFVLRSLAPTQPRKAFEHTHWQPNDRLFDAEKAMPIQLDDDTKGIVLPIGGFVTVVPESAFTYVDTKDTEGKVLEHDLVLDQEVAADSVTMLIRIRPDDFRGPRTIRKDTVEGHVAYSKLCTHLGCPVSLYEQQTHKLLCPCHQSQFLVTEGARPVFGPAARSLPQLAIYVDSEGFFRARGDFNQPVGPGYWERS